ncbi:MAG TPA: STAS domain-containing protein [Acidimicrobiia bacterium]|jgi:anti-anti-sigma regulatory factor
MPERTPSTHPARPGSCRFSVDARDDGVVGVSVDGDLDPEAARTLVELVEVAIGTPGTSRHVEIDLRKLRACSNSGVRALASCAELGARVREGLQFRVGIAPEVVEYTVDGSVTLKV